ncbi:twitching motility protein [Myxococcus stipitatus DSM 14675]|uniref:Twitching motility protein n=1 Tax=Myxococcus stipitatus (strain DSM 14675 / JCM 12634 / Mx s8) TaxID=1278073 RepID=L7UM12_MYXSD|nr:PilT/PilU family type 4a pilus ATPase [Myxococcus stipitatus]AGC48592.1 twitching motility protein [Myxococcus stipitatus DSM 14675]
MRPLAELLRHLARPGVTELTLATGRPPMIRAGGGTYEPLDSANVTTDDVVRALQAMVGIARASTVTDAPSQWSITANGLGALSIAAMRRGDIMHLRLSRAAEAAASGAVPAPTAAGTSTTPPGQTGASAPQAGVGQASATTAVRRSGAGSATPGSSASAQQSASGYASAGNGASAQQGGASQTAASAQVASAASVAQEAARVQALSRLTGGARDLAVVLEQGRSSGASDIHVVAERPVLFRLAGDLVPQGGALDSTRVEGMLMPVVPERLRPVLERDGSCDFSLDSPAMGRFRVNVSRHRTGLKGTFRVIAREVPTLESLGLPSDIAKATHHHQGLIVVTGPSGHGKTSTLAALVDLINRETSHHVLTVEDPVEFVHPRKKALISQREVGTHTKTFGSALKGSLREDPDVIVVGELRDTETVRMALAAAETGHLLISTMNTPSAAKTIDRLIDLFPPADQQQVRLSLASGLRLIVSQRLMLGADGKSMVAAAEVLPGSVALGNLIRDNKTYQIPSLQQRGKSLGIIRFEDSLTDLVRAGKVKLEVAKGFVDNPDELEAMVTGRRPGAAVAAPETPQDGARLLSKMGSLMGRKGG